VVATYLQHKNYNMRVLERIISIYAPHECVGCGEEGALLCIACRTALSSPVTRCYRCHQSNKDSKTCTACRRHTALFRVRAVTRYEQISKDMIWKLKFGNGKAAAKELAITMSLTASDFPKNALVVNVPTASGRVRLRGYDQAALIARALAHEHNLVYAPLLARIGQERQVGLKRHERFSQLEQAFRVRKSSSLQGAHVVLVDDVITTGASLEAAAKVLKAAGAKRIVAIVFAQA